MTRILVVDDAAVDRELASALLADAGFATEFAGDGREALRRIGEVAPDLVLTDLQMPEMNGLELVEAVRERHPRLPVVLVTAHGSEEIAAAALRAGAASYVPKRNLHHDLAPTLRRVLDATAARPKREAVLPWLAEAAYRFVLDNDPQWIRPLVAYLQEEVNRRRICDDTEVIQVGVALNEALCNACNHGNLEVDSAVREQGMDVYCALLEERRGREPYRHRRVHLSAALRADEAVFVVRDEGKGFDPATVPDPRDPKNLERVSGRGLLLMRTFMDEVRFSDRGNEVTMVKRRVSPPTAEDT